ncbi:DNA repair RAD51-like protein B [Nymphaea thermarum]|nr:DNA repair RAD51-like protein B [Nymphaea thermarum]
MERPHPLEQLQASGIAPADVQKLKDAGFFTVEAVFCSRIKDLLRINGINKRKFLSCAASKLASRGFATASQLYAQEFQISKITSGSRELDQILGGGFEIGSITEICGESYSGKTELCHTLCVTCQLPSDREGGGKKAMYLASDDIFMPQRLFDIGERFGLNGRDVLSNVVYRKFENTDHQLRLLSDVASMMRRDRYALIIVDCATALYRRDFPRREEHAEKLKHLAQFLRRLDNLAFVFGVAAVITNQITQTFPIGGNTIAHASTTRLALSKGSGGEHICKVVHSPCLVEAEARFQISREGVRDARTREGVRDARTWTLTFCVGEYRSKLSDI